MLLLALILWNSAHEISQKTCYYIKMFVFSNSGVEEITRNSDHSSLRFHDVSDAGRKTPTVEKHNRGLGW
ncbi:hypothetical protein GBAR_LOCUS31120 [Geodia barretti]|uniref:Secreted protein n=1 Tax=Geodia barretti TaxID=519541 RepID=A0AA35U007_GEOBA|nr:hypothetical protein GBAR_LOCUS31120 [Geodia barretti]